MRALLALVVLSACAIDDEPELSETTQAVTWTTVTHRDCLTSSCFDPVFLGDASTSTCFLAGAKGAIFDGSTLFISIDATTNQWVLRSGAGHFDSIGAVCVQTAANRVVGMAHNGKTLLGLATPGRRCFLQGFWWDPPGLNYGLPNYNDTQRVYVDHGRWWVETNMVNHETDSGAFAVCIDVPVFVGNWSFGHDAAGSITNPIAQLQNSGACGLTAINGAFTQAGPHAGIRLNNTYPMTWSMTLDEHVGASVSCVQPF